MDKNSITGLVLITLILIGFWFINKPSPEQQEALQQQRDSLRQVEVLRAQEFAAAEQLRINNIPAQSLALESISDTTAVMEQMRLLHGNMAPFVVGEQQFFILENNKLKITYTNKGGRVHSVELKDYKTHDGKPLILFEGDDNKFGFSFTHNTRVFNTDDLFFNLKSKTDSTLSFELATEFNEKLVFKYKLPADEFMSHFSIKTENLKNLMATPRGSIDLNWETRLTAFEKGRTTEREYSGLYYKHHLDEVDWLSRSKNDSEDLRTKVKWVAFKSQFFSSIIIADDAFSSAQLATDIDKDDLSAYLRTNSAEITIPMDFGVNQEIGFRLYYGPNHYYTLNNYGKDLELSQLLPLGWGILGWINRLAVIPVFNYLQNHIASYGIIILILTILIKIVLFPLTYKSYVSSAKMKVLKPQIDEINERIPKDKAMERQQAVMALYKKAGVNPMGGCLPMLLQMPILIALFRFFPASIELRQESFLWATDLSSYDSIFDLPFNIPFYGAHVSLFTILMAVTNIVYTKMNSEMTQSANQMPGMKSMMYMMPIMFLFFFNSYSSGLSYYYFISTLITIGQTLLIRQFVDEKLLLKKIQANQKKPVQKSKFAQRLEEMTKQQHKIKKK